MIKISNLLKTLVLVINISALTFAQGLELHYSFDNLTTPVTLVPDATGNGHEGTLVNGAEVKAYGDYMVLDLGDSNGYLEMGAGLGTTISSLTDFSVSTYLFVPESTSLSFNGNFLWALGNSNNMARDANGGMFFTVKDTRFAISKKHWTGEQSVSQGASLEQGAWKHIVYSQSGTEGKLYIDGVLITSSSIDITPADLGATTYNYIGRSLYSGDAYLAGALVYDFRLYSKSLSADSVELLTSELNSLNATIDYNKLVLLSESLDFDDQVISDIKLLSDYDGVAVTWESSDANVLTTSGQVFRPEVGSAPVTVTLAGFFTKGDAVYSKEYQLTVLPYPADEEAVRLDIDTLAIEGNITNLRSSLDLPLFGLNGTTITWESSHSDILSNDGQLLTLSPVGGGKKTVTLTATVTKGSSSQEQVFTIMVAVDDASSAYLFAYFTGNSGDQEAIRFALSNDGYNYRALNNDLPIIDSEDISSTGGVRDPHILRGPDGWFYMVVTDMVSANGWSSNRAMVMLKSKDLLNWTSSIVNIQEKYENQEDLLRVWAPQSIYDEAAGKFMLYWSMLYEGGNDIIYYAYANSNFTDIEGTPEQLFYHPTGESCIDGDIIKKDSLFYLFFKTEGNGNGIKKAVSDNLTSGYTLIDQYLQQTDVAVEGSSVFRMINSDKYILMYDMYSSGKYQFTESYDLDNFSIVDDEVLMNFHPRHGTVIPVNDEEAKSLVSKWGTVSELFVHDVEGDYIQDGGVSIDNENKQIIITLEGGDISSYDPVLVTLAGASISPALPSDFSAGPVVYTLSIEGVGAVEYTVTVNSNETALKSTPNNMYHYIYPNPVSDCLYVEASYEYVNNNELYVYNAIGTQVLSTKVSGSITSIDVVDFKSSPYFLVYTMNDKVLWSETFLVK